jgi:Glycosyl hydrolases family 16
VPVVSSDIQFRLSGGALKRQPEHSLDGAMSSTGITTRTDNNLFDDVSSADHAAGDTEYRGFYVRNNNGTDTLFNAVVWVSANTTSTESEVAIAVADEGVNVTMETIANDSTAPVGPSFRRPTSKASGIGIGNLGPGQFRGIWIRRTVQGGSTPQTADTAGVMVAGDSGESAVPAPIQGQGYAVVCQDDFNTFSPGGADWPTDVWWDNNDPADAKFVQSSVLHLVSRRSQGFPNIETSTFDRHTWQEGYFECRMRWQGVAGNWPAFWLISEAWAQNGTCASAEIDVFEGKGNEPNSFYGNLHARRAAVSAKRRKL